MRSHLALQPPSVRQLAKPADAAAVKQSLLYQARMPAIEQNEKQISESSSVACTRWC